MDYVPNNDSDVRARFAAALHQRLDAMGVSKAGKGRTAALAALSGVSRSSAAKWLAGRVIPEAERLLLLARLLDVSTDVLFGMQASAPPSITAPGPGHCIAVERILDMGTDTIYVDSRLLHQEENASAIFAVIAYGSGMEPTIKRNSTLLGVRGGEIRHEGIYALKYFAATIIRRATIADNGHIRLSSDNPHHADVIDLGPCPSESKVEILGRITRGYCLSL